IINHVVKFDHVHDNHRPTVIKCFTCTSVIKIGVGIAVHTSFTNGIPKVVRSCPIENWSRNVNTKVTRSHTKVKFHNLSDVHTRWHPKWVQHDINWCSVWQARHVFNWNDARNNPIASVKTGHCISNLDMQFMCDVSALEHGKN